MKNEFYAFLKSKGAIILETAFEGEYARFIFMDELCVIWNSQRFGKLFFNKLSKNVWEAFFGDKKISQHLFEKKTCKSRRNAKLKEKIFERDGNTCFYSGKTMDLKDTTLEHLIPKSRGGKSNLDNLVCCLREENIKVSDKTLSEKLFYRQNRRKT